MPRNTLLFKFGCVHFLQTSYEGFPLTLTATAVPSAVKAALRYECPANTALWQKIPQEGLRDFCLSQHLVNGLRGLMRGVSHRAGCAVPLIESSLGLPKKA